MHHSHLPSNQVISAKEGVSTLIHLPPEEAEYNNSSVLSQLTVTQECTILSNKRRYKAKKRQNSRTSKSNKEVEQAYSPDIPKSKYAWHINR